MRLTKILLISLIVLAAMMLLGCGDRTIVKQVGSCMVEEDGRDVHVTCSDGTEATVPGGADGADGVDNILGVIDPCGQQAQRDEVILQLNDGTYIAWFKNVGLVTLDIGTIYVTTDGTSCRFELTLDGIEDNF